MPAFSLEALDGAYSPTVENFCQADFVLGFATCSLRVTCLVQQPTILP